MQKIHCLIDLISSTKLYIREKQTAVNGIYKVANFLLSEVGDLVKKFEDQKAILKDQRNSLIN